ncbi:MAG: hypothetical protein ACK47B_19420 [Armatimonadota bacterium]
MSLNVSQDQLLQGKVGEVRRRIRLLLAQQWLCVGLAAAMAASLLLVALTKLQWWTDAMDYIWALILLGGIVGFIVGWSRKITPMAAAQIADERAGLKERLSTAVELSSRERTELTDAQIHDAARHAESLRASEVLPWRAPKHLRWVAAAGAVLAAVVFVPDLPIFHTKQELADREAMRTEGERIQQIAKSLEKKAREQRADDKNAEILRQISQNMKQVGKDAAKNRISKKQALLKMGELQKQLRDAEEKLGGGKPGQKSMDQVAADLQEAANKAAGSGDKEKAKSLQQMAENLSKRDFDGAKRQLEEMAQKIQSGKMSSEEAQKAAETLEQMAASMDKSGLQEAAEQMRAAAEQLKKASEQVKQLEQQMAQAKTDAERQQIQQQMEQTMQQAAQQAASDCKQAGGT